MSQLWHWRAKLDTDSTGVVDGDTYDLIADCGFYTSRRIRVRAIGIDTNEIYGRTSEAEYNIGIEQKQFVEDWFKEAREEWDDEWPVLVRTEQAKGKYGRWMADIERRYDGSILREEIVDEWPETDLDVR